MPSPSPIVRAVLLAWAGLWVLDFLLSLGGPGLVPYLWLDAGELLGGSVLAFPGLLTHALVHMPRELLHVGFNAYLFWVFGPEVERLFPGRRFVWLLVRAALAGAAVTVLLAALGLGSFRGPVLGGSGLVFCVLCANAAVYPERVLNLILFRVPMKYFALFLVGLDVLWLLASLTGQGNGTAQQMHLAGALVGWLAVGGPGRHGAPGILARLLERRRRARAGKAADAARAADAEEDRILAKISREGMSALSEKERQFLLGRSKKRR